ncbi:hypothetical protein DM860_010364 [Cuscuta australis]|uniref:Uncharacterized protein n=1 Tax=Cuscuta australis TaxID=267555 RepID=A0A328E2L2_9ASTE|nr:hypothetical protein DM860_010364 [Cuscuta australis]
MAATLCQIPTFHIKLSFSPLPCRRTANHFHLPSIPRFQKSVFASIKKPRGSRQARRRSADLCNDIRDFLSVAGLPHDHIPTTNELRQHGREDLANVVRRRGYKYIRELLGSLKKSFDGQDEKMKNSSDDVDGGVNSVIDDVEFNETYFVEDSSSYPSLQEKASRFIQNGELDSIDGKLCFYKVSRED